MYLINRQAGKHWLSFAVFVYHKEMRRTASSTDMPPFSSLPWIIDVGPLHRQTEQPPSDVCMHLTGRWDPLLRSVWTNMQTDGPCGRLSLVGLMTNWAVSRKDPLWSLTLIYCWRPPLAAKWHRWLRASATARTIPEQKADKAPLHMSAPPKPARYTT